MWKRIVGGFSVLIACGLYLALMLGAQGYLFTKIHLKLASARGVYSTAEQGAIDHVLKGYQGIEKYEIIYAGPNSFDGSDPHIWYVITRVWAERDSQGRPLGQDSKEYETPGGFWLNTAEG